MDKEIMKDIPGYEGVYAISNFGRVWSYANGRHWGKWVTGSVLNGYHNVVLYYGDNKPEMLKVHRLVSESFLLNPDDKKTVNHKDGNKLNNYYRNLEWATYGENNLHAVRILQVDRHHVKTKQLSMDGELLHIYQSRKEASEATGIGQAHIVSCCVKRRHCNSAGGFRWENG